MNNLTEHQKGLAAIFIAALLWSTGGIFIKLISLNSLQLSALRSLFAAITFFVIFKSKLFKFNIATVVNALFYAGILILFVIATKTTTAANAIFLQYTAPIYVLILEPLLLKTYFERYNILTIVICFVGMLLFFMGELTPGHMNGNIIALLSGVSFAAFLIGMRKNKPEYQYPTIFLGNIFITFISGFALFDAVFILNDLLMVSFLGIFQIGIAYAIFSWGLKKVYAIEASLISMIEPVLNPVWVFIGYGEQPSNWAILGGVIILLGIGLRTFILDKYSQRRIKDKVV
ncbi:MAG TPA: EamA family transporter [Ignavibacteriaceae bacterium]|nr:EamA family transporter [Ignavibacteriaceae bacterium]